MPYFGEVREFATGRETCSVLDGKETIKLETQKRIWNGNKWVTPGRMSYYQTLEAIIDEKVGEVVFDPEAP